MHLVLVRMPLQLELQGRLHGGNLVPCVLRPILQNCAHVLDYVRALINIFIAHAHSALALQKLEKYLNLKLGL